jgi:hypothetical protein
VDEAVDILAGVWMDVDMAEFLSTPIHIWLIVFHMLSTTMWEADMISTFYQQRGKVIVEIVEGPDVTEISTYALLIHVTYQHCR